MANRVCGLEPAITLLTRAVELDQKQQFGTSLVCYQEGMGLLMEAIKDCSCNEMRTQLRSKLTQYMDRAEKVKECVEKQKEAGKYHEEICIENNSTGHRYERIFSRFLDETVTEIKLEDPYIRSTHQIYNFLRFCELVVKKSPNIKSITLITSKDDEQRNNQGQETRLKEIQTGLRKYNVQLSIDYSKGLHDREIRFDNGWIFKLGRGLDFYKKADSQFSIGFCDFDLRQCHETKIDIFHQRHTVSAFSAT